MSTVTIANPTTPTPVGIRGIVSRNSGWLIVVVIVAVVALVVGLGVYGTAQHDSYAAKLKHLGFDPAKSYPLDSLNEVPGGKVTGRGSFLGIDINGTSGPEIKFALRLPDHRVAIVILPYAKFNLVVRDRYPVPRVKFNGIPWFGAPSQNRETVADLLEGGSSSIDLYINETFYRSQIAPHLRSSQ